MFKAARGDTPTRPSTLRQNSSVSDSPASNNFQYGPPIDPQAFSRNFLDEHIRASQPPPLPPMPGMNGVHNRQNHPSAFSPRHSAQGQGNDASPRTASNNGGRDLRAMEDDLRRMLKVNVLGN